MLSYLRFQFDMKRIEDQNIKEMLIDLEVRMRSNISSEFQKRSREKVGQRQYLKEIMVENFLEHMNYLYLRS